MSCTLGGGLNYIDKGILVEPYYQIEGNAIVDFMKYVYTFTVEISIVFK